MARIDHQDRIEFFGFDSGQSLAGALVEAGEWLSSSHPGVDKIDLTAASIRFEDFTHYVVLPIKKGKS